MNQIITIPRIVPYIASGRARSKIGNKNRTITYYYKKSIVKIFLRVEDFRSTITF